MTLSDKPKPIKKISPKDDTEYPEGIQLYDPDDYDAQRNILYDDIKRSFQETYPVSYNGMRLEINDIDYEGPERFTLAEQKKALLTGGYLTRRLRGTMKLIDETTGDLLEEKKTTLMKVPVLTDRGTFIHNGNEIGVIRQARLLPGVYTRRQANGQLEAQFNARVGTGKGFRVGLEPQTAQYRLKIAQSNLHLYSLLKDLGSTDDELARSWGQEILEMNKRKYDPRALDRAYEKLVQKYKQEPKADRETKAKAVRETLEEIQVAERVMKKNLPNWTDRIKSAAWRVSGEQKEILDGYLEAPMEKRANFSTRELDQIVQFLNENHEANIPIQGSKSEKEQAIITFTSGNSTFNPALAQVGQDGLEQVRQESDFLPSITAASLPSGAAV